MFKNLSQRERLMAIAVAALLPIALVMFLVFSVGGQLAEKTRLIEDLQNEKESLERKKQIGQWAQMRQTMYRSASLPSESLDESILQYQLWLTNLARDDIKLQSVDVRNTNRGVQTVGRDIVLNNVEFKLLGVGSPRQMTDLLYRLNHTRVLHRVLSFTVVPQMTGAASRRTPTGLLELSMTIEVACLPNAPDSNGFSPEERDDMLRSMDEYHRIVSRRNLFGPPNTEPAVQKVAGAKVDYGPGQPISVALEISNPDRDQRFNWELVDPENPEAKLNFEEGATEATFTSPPLEIGSHRFVIRATDDGWPPKSGDLRLSITVSDPPPDDPAPDPPKHARDTYL
ncbi:MAG: hypothetical protein ACR2NP_07725, partial [Pirellulaceae bacterium]